MKPRFNSLRRFLDSLSDAFYLWRVGASLRSVVMYLGSRRGSAASKIFHKHAAVLAEMKALVGDGRFKQDWFTHNVPYWMEAFDRSGLRSRAIKALEIGSFEGLSACFILKQLPQATLTCVDAWAGSNEYAEIDCFSIVEEAFDRNTAPWRSQVTKYKGLSLSYFATLEKETFDFIYIDGSHHGDDVIADAICAFTHLKVGGVMIFDDYLWRRYPRLNENPAAAINAFLHLITGRYQILMVYYQLALIKTADRSAPQN